MNVRLAPFTIYMYDFKTIGYLQLVIQLVQNRHPGEQGHNGGRQTREITIVQ